MKDDLISRQAAIQTIDDLPNCYNGYSDTYDKAYIIGVLEELPSAQPEIIRCKDCKYITKHYDTDGNAPYWFVLNGILERITMDFVIMRKGEQNEVD